MRIPHNALIVASGAIAALTLITGTAIGADVFSDVSADFWARQDIEWANDNHVMTGPGGQDRRFEPNRAMTRAEVAAVSHRLFIRMQQEIDMLSRKLVELEARIDVLEDMNDHGTSSSNSWGSTSSSSSVSSSSLPSLPSSSSLPPPPTPIQPGSAIWLGFPTDRSRRLIMTVGMSGSEMVPAVTTNGRGSVNLRWTSDGLCYEAGVSGMTGTPTGLAFYRGDRKAAGTLLKTFTFTGMDRAQGCWPSLTSEDWQSFLDSNIYAVVTTDKYPQGEIRGQVNFRR